MSTRDTTLRYRTSSNSALTPSKTNSSENTFLRRMMNANTRSTLEVLPSPSTSNSSVINVNVSQSIGNQEGEGKNQHTIHENLTGKIVGFSFLGLVLIVGSLVLCLMIVAISLYLYIRKRKEIERRKVILREEDFENEMMNDFAHMLQLDE
ncbi:predicted protein [Naegleria gruberi]|uniref:Predicted protein n=1 Tax=Naegleria gruberi TaxID=5762 RepID=D2VE67_NAEGR|nr:uncharacterized protein NAEGRDRAFT_67171 [Naegleria gruberi]EFC44829.1 predicted protein [Naegleria gruberi]|eukprot:XP_002677573.1 predicted protein [Naegleria gruberi strain NEG-M]